jgi:hypothetical protein
MTPQTQCCHNTHCPTRGQHRQGNIHVHSRAEQRYRCSQCGRTFLVGRRVWMAMAMAVPARLWLGVPSARTTTKRYSQRRGRNHHQPSPLLTSCALPLSRPSAAAPS